MPDISPQPGYLSSAVVNATTTVAAVAGVTGLKVRVYRLALSGAASTITFQDGTTSISGPMPLANGTPLVLDNSGEPWFTTSAGNAFNISIGGTQVSGVIYYRQESSPPN